MLVACALALSLGLSGACSADEAEPTHTEDPSAGDPVQATLGVAFELRVGQRAILAAEGLELRFLEVSEDSRCPVDVVCVWAGRAVIRLSAALQGQAAGELSLQTDKREPHVHAGFALQLQKLEPVPRSGQPASSGSSVATLVVTRPE